MPRVLTVTLNPALDLTVQLPALRLGEVNRSDNLQVHAAGKGLNVAQVLADLGHQLTVTGFLGEANAQPFEQLFAARGFADEFVRVAGETRSNIKLAEADGRITDIASNAWCLAMSWSWWPAAFRAASSCRGSSSCCSGSRGSVRVSRWIPVALRCAKGWPCHPG